MKLIDLTGQKFGRLTVIERVKKPEHLKGKKTYWLCRCDCGKENIVTRSDLRSKKTSSCGCYNVERNRIDYGKAAINDLIYSYKNKAKRRNIPFELSEEKFLELTKQNCFYCGKEPSTVHKNDYNNGNYIHNGIDRIDSSKGYTIENCVPCCGRCNQAKMSEIQSDFFEWIKTVHSNLSDKGLI
jgi:hypothetical protein